MAKKYVYFFGGKKTDGHEGLKNLLGGKGANLAEMAGHKNLRLPVPPGFTVTTEVCTYFYKNKGRYPQGLKAEVNKALAKVEKLVGKKFGNPANPLLVSVRSGARKSMPGMMETVLNIGLTAKTIPGLVKQAGGDRRFVYDAYRRLITMYADVVMEKAAGLEPREEGGIRKQLEKIMTSLKKEKGYKSDTDLTADDLEKMISLYKEKIREVLKKEFPDDPEKQLWGALGAVFSSWRGKRAISYRRIENIPDEWGTAVNIQAMVFGNMGKDSATGVAFSRNPGNGENSFYGEYLINAQGEDVVAGIRTPAPLNEYSKSEHNKNLLTLEKAMPQLYKELVGYRNRLEKHFHEMQDIEFTIEKGRLYMLQCRTGKRNGPAAVRMAVDMLKEKLITIKEAVNRVTPSQLEELLHPIIDPEAEAENKPLAAGLPAGPGAAAGQIVFSAAAAMEGKKQGKKLILVREETNPEDVDGMRAAEAILTARGGMTSHAALVARGWGKCCIVGCAALHIDHASDELRIAGKILKEGDWLTLNGTKGNIYWGQLAMMDAGEENKTLNEFLKICGRVKKLEIRANADTADDIVKAKGFGAEGVGLFRTEHMFYGHGADEPLFILRQMIMASTEEEREKAANKLFPFIKKDFKAALLAMSGYPVIIRLLDPPLHEFIPRQEAKRQALAKELGISQEELAKRARKLHESNPMMGHRGVRLGVTYPEISRMQIQAIFEAAAELINEGKKPFPEIMIPVVSDRKELDDQRTMTEVIYHDVLKKFGLKKITYAFGTMIEIPRAALLAGELAIPAEFFSFGTNDLTQTTFGFSRDDIGSFLPVYLKKGILADDPFQTLDQKGVGELIKIALERGRKTRQNLEVGLCGEHGGDPRTIRFCHEAGLTYVSCSPFRVPIALLASAQAALNTSVKK
ncbi:MAG: pyruvate, phosphate dikinase [Patescibacteria group bacterium]